MTTTAQIAATIEGQAILETSAHQSQEQTETKWPIPYAAMFMASISAVLWYGIYAAGSAIAAMI